ncbi:DUF5347 domain-containing protein [Rosenbergiella epipactidis]|uniref:DUF5347 domain-containing protein n=1 Tax=Rosenbergiella epipactidis TaxID=1544694 RepID=UPI001F4D9365|nr:DUF5347 domain-containing protein [Rosenbergiella epipactidis]
MAIEGANMVQLSAGQRVSALNHIASIRGQFWGDGWKEVERFIDDMRDPRDSNYEGNIRTLSAIFYLAKIPTNKHQLSLSELTTDEKTALISAMNQLKAVVSLFPKRITLPN